MTGINDNGLDQFYTNQKYAKCCYTTIMKKIPDFDSFDIELEPSAGSGSFYNLLSPSKKIGMDLDPKCKGVIKRDFFEYSPPSSKKIITIGNPPFGRNASLAIKFFNHAASFSKAIAFIVPKSFKKDSIQNKLDLNFHLKYEKDCPEKSFVVNDDEYDVPCVFQIWTHEDIRRNKKVLSQQIIDWMNERFEFVKKNNGDIAFRRVGGNAGKCTCDYSEISRAKETSNYFIKIEDSFPDSLGLPRFKAINQITRNMNTLDFENIRNSTAGPRSISQQEFITTCYENRDGIFGL